MKSTEKQNKVVIVGATGLVGSEILRTLAASSLDVDFLVALASERSAGTEILFRGKTYKVEIFDPEYFKNAKWVFFSGKDGLSEEFCPPAAAAGAWVIDNSAVFRMNPDIPACCPGSEFKSRRKKTRNHCQS